METMTKTQESDLLGSIEQAIHLANDGMDPSSAIAKVASQKKYAWDHTSRMIEAFNASKTMKWLQSTEGAEKAASFAIADPTAVRGILYPKTVPTPLEKAAATLVPLACHYSETEFFESAEEKAASVTPALAPLQSTWASRDPNMLFTQAQKEASALDRQVAEAATQVAIKRSAFDHSLNKLANYFRQSVHESFEQVEKLAAATWDDVGGLMDIIWELSSAEKFGEKRASGPTPKTFAPDREPYQLISEVREKRATYAEAKDICTELENQAVSYHGRLTALQLKCATKEAGLMDPSQMVMGQVSKLQPESPAYTPPDPMAGIPEAKGQMVNPEMSAESSQLDTQVMLHQLMQTDPVLSQRDPGEVMNAFNMFSQSSPQLAQNPIAMQAMLRKYLESSGLDTMDVSGMATMNKTLGEGQQMRGDKLMAG